MASIKTAISLTDKMSEPLRNITNAMNMMLSAWDSVEGATSSGIPADGIEGVREELNKANKALEDFNNNLDDGSNKAGDIAKKLAGIAASIGIAKIATDAIEFASNLVEVQNVVDVSFGQNAAVVDEWAKTTLNAFGLNELSAKQFAGTMGAMLKSSGLTGDAVADMSMRITELAGDMASFYNLEGEEAFAKIRSGISGETEPLKQLGINMSVANLEAFAMSQGIEKAYDKMTQAEQVTLRYNYLLQATADAQGDFTRTSDSFANQQKLLQENWKALTGELATNVLPILADLFSTLNNIISFVSDNIDWLMPLAAGLAAIVATIVIFTHTAQIAAVATKIWTGAQAALNAIMAMNPIAWIIIAVIALITVIIIVANKIAQTGGVATTTFGVIAGGFAVLGAFIWNTVVGVINAVIQFLWTAFVEPWIDIIEFVLNVFNGGFNSFGDAVKNLLGNIISWFLSLGEVVTKIIDAIFGTNWTAGLENLKGKVLDWGKNENAITLDRTAPEVLNRIAYTDAYTAGAQWGDTKWNNLTGSLTDGMDAIMGDVSDIAEYSGETAGALNATKEDLKYLRDIAEAEAINRFTTAEVKVDLGGVTNNVNSGMDLDGVIDYLATGVQEALQVVAEGVYV